MPGRSMIMGNVAPTTLGKYTAVPGTDEEQGSATGGEKVEVEVPRAEVAVGSSRRAVLKVGGMTCSNCSAAVQRALDGLERVTSCEVDLIGEKATVCYDSDGRFTAKDLCEEVEDIGFEAKVLEDVQQRKKMMGIGSSRRAVLKVGGMTCSNCSAAVQRALDGMKQVTSCEVDLIGEKATVCYDSDGSFTAKNLCEEVEDIGFEAQVIEDVQSEAAGEDAEGGRAVLHLLDALSPKASLSCIRGKEGVLDASAEGTLLKVMYDPSKVGARALLASLKADGFTAVSVAPQEMVTAASHAGSGAAAGLGSALFCTTGIVVVCWILPCFVHCRPFLQQQILPGLDLMTLLICTLATPVQLLCASRFHMGAIHAVKSGVWDMNVLISLGTGLTYFYSLGVVLFAAVGPKLFGFHQCKMPPASYFEAPCLVITFILVGKSLEGWAKRKTSKALRDLLKLQPRTAHLLRNSAGGEQVENVPTELLELKDVVHVFPGEAAPADGILVSEAGAVAFDESLLTGESRPVTKGPGDFIIGGSKCVTGRAELRIERLGSKTMLSQITALVERAQLSRAPVQQVADSVAHRFVPFVVALASMTWLVWWALVFRFKWVSIVEINYGMQSEWPELDKVFFVLEHGLNVLLVACPCALGLATPTAVMTSTGVAAQHGILVRSGAVPLELGSKVTVVVLDKTGTLTQGRPRVEQVGAICPVDSSAMGAWQSLIDAYREVRSPAAARSEPAVATAWLKAAPSPGRGTRLWLPESSGGGDRERLREEAERALWWAVGSAELSSEHPLAKELVDVAGTVTRGALMKPSHFENVTGVGVRCELGKLKLEVCSAAHILQLGGDSSDALSEWVTSLRAGGATVIGVAIDGVPLAGVALKDALVPHARSCVAELQMAGMEVWMCSGDHTTAATVVARDCGIDKGQVVAEALPADKVAVVKRLQAAGKGGDEKHIVAMVGDGVNDAPALAAADIGVAIGAGHDVTVDAADIVLVRTDLRDLTTFFALARQTLWTIKFNFFWAFLFNVSCLPIAAGALWRFEILMTPQIAACLMLSSSLFVCFNSLRLRTFSPGAFVCKV